MTITLSSMLRTSPPPPPSLLLLSSSASASAASSSSSSGIASFRSRRSRRHHGTNNESRSQARNDPDSHLSELAESSLKISLTRDVTKFHENYVSEICIDDDYDDYDCDCDCDHVDTVPNGGLYSNGLLQMTTTDARNGNIDDDDGTPAIGGAEKTLAPPAAAPSSGLLADWNGDDADWGSRRRTEFRELVEAAEQNRHLEPQSRAQPHGTTKTNANTHIHTLANSNPNPNPQRQKRRAIRVQRRSANERRFRVAMLRRRQQRQQRQKRERLPKTQIIVFPEPGRGTPAVAAGNGLVGASQGLLRRRLRYRALAKGTRHDASSDETGLGPRKRIGPERMRAKKQAQRALLDLQVGLKRMEL